MKAVFLRALKDHDKAGAIISAIKTPFGPLNGRRFEVELSTLSAVPRSPFAYWVSDRLRLRFNELERFESGERCVRQGLATADDNRFVRAWWAVAAHKLNEHWYPFEKGGTFARYYGDPPAVVNWYLSGREIRNSPAAVPRNIRFFLRAGLTWPLRGVRFSAQSVGQGSVFSVAGKMAFAKDRDLPHLLALFNSQAFDTFIGFFAGKVGGVQYEVGLIQSIPVPNLSSADKAALAALARRAWSLRRGLDTRTETSHAFVLPVLLQAQGETLAARGASWSDHVRRVEIELATIQAEIDERCFQLYEIHEEDREAIVQGFGADHDESEGSEDEAEGDADGEEKPEVEAAADPTAFAADLVSWAVGVAFGRFDVCLVTGERALPAQPEPFDRLPVCSPAMLTGDDGLALAHATPGYPISFPQDGILVDDPGHPRDLTAAVQAVFETVFGVGADVVWQEAAALLDPRGHDLRNWLAMGFFDHHLRHYSKSRRRAPILWQLSILSGRYSVWCYAHRMTRDSVLGIQNEIVAPKLAHEERRLSSLVEQAGQTPSAQDRAEIASQEVLVDELRTLAEEVKCVAPLWNPDLDDGIVVVLAPLWRLVPTHRVWQKELQTRWDQLRAGAYDWAHLAMHIWPERVIPKCAPDRSIAIAQGLEDVFWAEGADGKWTRRAMPTRPIAQLVAERTSPAVKAALDSLLEAPSVVAGGRSRGRNLL